MNIKQLVVGILAHVDAGKTTLAESILYKSGSIRKPGRVDHGDAFLDITDLNKLPILLLKRIERELKG